MGCLRGDLVAVPSWSPLRFVSAAAQDDALDLFRFSDSPIVEHLHADRVEVETATAPTAIAVPTATDGALS